MSLLITGVRCSRIATALALASSLSGCMAGGSDDTPAAAAPASSTSSPKAFRPLYGSLQSEGVAARVSTVSAVSAKSSAIRIYDISLLDRLSSFTASATRNLAAKGQADKQEVVVASGGLGASGALIGRLESDDGGLYRGAAGNAAGDTVYFTNTPAANMESSLGVTSLAHSYIGLGSFGATASTPTRSAYDGYTFGLFGGRKTSDMPTTGAATYKGAFEGTETSITEYVVSPQKTDLYGAMRADVDFGSGKVTGRVDDLQSYRGAASSTAPVKTPVDYSLMFTGDVLGSGFAGSATMVQAGGSTPYAGVTQSGVAQGGFFGPQAAETAGALAVTTSDGKTKTLVSGAFGAKKQ